MRANYFRFIFSKVMWVGRATVLTVGLALTLALIFGAASVALGAKGGNTTSKPRFEVIR